MSKMKTIHTKYVQRITKQCKNPKKIVRLNKKKKNIRLSHENACVLSACDCHYESFKYD